MRAGKLDRVITLESLVETVDEYGVPRETWVSMTPLRAQVVQASTEEFFRSYGVAAESIVIFRTRFLAGVSSVNRIAFNGQLFDIAEIKEIGRRRGLEIRAVARAVE